MLDNNLRKYVSSFHRVDSSKLKLAKINPSTPITMKWAENFIVAKQCFSNAMNMSVVGECDAVVGYVLLEQFGICIEHAWNRDEEGDFDLTADLHWVGHDKEDNIYIELVHFSFDEISELYSQDKGIDHLALMKDDRYKHLFGR